MEEENADLKAVVVKGKRSETLPFVVCLTQTAGGVGIIVGKSCSQMTCIRYLFSFSSAAIDGTLRLVSVMHAIPWYIHVINYNVE